MTFARGSRESSFAKPTDIMSMPIHSLSGAGVDLESSGELPVSRTVNAHVERHAAGEFTRDNALPEGSPLGRSQTPKSRGLRQPAGK
jgi:hypothetical protein